MSSDQRRPPIRLVERGVGLPINDVKWLHTQGFKGHAEVPNPATWYRPDGTPLVGRTDAYHLRLYRLKGWTLKPPMVEEPKPQEPRRALPVIASRVVRFLGDRTQWEGTASELANGPVAFGRSAIGDQPLGGQSPRRELLLGLRGTRAAEEPGEAPGAVGRPLSA